MTKTLTNDRKIEIRTIDKTIHQLVGKEQDYGLSYDSKPYDEIETSNDSTIDDILETLSEKEKTVIVGRFFKRQALEAIGREMGVTKEVIRQREAKALRKLRHPERINKLKKIARHFGFINEDEQSTIERQRKQIEEDCQSWKERVEERAKIREEFKKLLSVESPISYKLLFPELSQNA
jgi:hypothetical protein